MKTFLKYLVLSLVFIAGVLVLVLIEFDNLQVTFETNGGSPDVVVIYDEEEGLDIPDDPTKEGHTFLGWFLEDTLETPFSVEALLALEPSGSYTVYASWQVNQYTITFDPDNGSPITSITQDYGTPIVAPEEPTKTNFLFVAWNPSLPTTMPAFDMDLKALWEYDPVALGKAPVYQGMDVTAVDPVSTLPQVNYQWSHEQSDIIDDIPIIEIPEQPDIVYYSARNEDVYVRVILDNPDSQVVLRFTLNGVVYQSFEFEDGSNSEVLIVKVNAGDLSGIRELTIDEIKYVENVSNDIKDADFEGDRTITMAVTYEQLIEASVTEEVITSTSYRSVITISDPDNLSAVYENPPVFYLSDGTNIIYTQTLTNGNNLIDYPYLHPSQTYVYAVATTYDLLDGNGAQIYVASQNTVESFSILSFNFTEANLDSISFDFSVYDPENTGTVSAIELYQGDNLVQSLSDLSLRQFSNLLSNNAYEIRVTYTYDLNDGNNSNSITISINDKTLSYFEPTIELSNIVTTNNNVTFDLLEQDEDSVGNLISIELFQNEELFETLEDISLRSFENLIFNTAYKIKVTYVYNLNDGNGDIELIKYYDAITEGYYLSFETNLEGILVDPVMLVRVPNFELPILEKEGYSLVGWFFDGYENEFDLNIPLSEDTTIYAKWEINQYTISFISNGGTDVISIVQDYLSNVSEPETPSKEKYTFEGWYSDVAKTEKYNFTTMPSENITLYAKWTFDQAYFVYGISDVYLENSGTVLTVEGYVTANIDTNIFFIEDQTGSIYIDSTNAPFYIKLMLQDAWLRGYGVEIQATKTILDGAHVLNDIQFINTSESIGFTFPNSYLVEDVSQFNEYIAKNVTIENLLVTDLEYDENGDYIIYGLLNEENVIIRMVKALIETTGIPSGIDIDSSITLTVSVYFMNEILLYIDNSSDGISLAQYPEGIDLSKLDGTYKDVLFAAAESYLLENVYGGVPLYRSASRVMFSSRTQLFSEEYNGVLGYGEDFSQFTADDSTVEMSPGRMGNAGEYTWRSSFSTNPTTFNPWLADDSVSSDFIATFTGGFYEFYFDASKTGYEILPSMAASLPVAVNPETINGKEYSTVWQIPVRDDLVWTFHPGIATRGFAEGFEKLDASDWLWTWRLAMERKWFRAISGGEDFITKGIKGAAEFIADPTEANWQNVGLKLVDGNTIQLEYVSEQSEFEVVDGFTGALMAAINQELYESLGSTSYEREEYYGRNELSVAANGEYYLEVYIPDQLITFKKNMNYVDKDLYFYTGKQFRFMQWDNVFEEFIAGRLESASVPTSRVDEFLRDPRVKTSPGATTWRLMMNMFGTEANRDAYIAENPDVGINPDFVPEPILSYKEFRQALYYGFDRYTAAVEVVKTYLPAHTLFAPTYFLDGSSGLSVRSGEAGAEVVSRFGGESNAYFPDAALDLFKEAVSKGIEDGHYTVGTREEYTEIELVLTYASSGDTARQAMIAELERQYETLLVDTDNYVRIVLTVNDVDFPGNYYDYMMQAATDLGIGAISHNILDAPGFFEQFRDDNRGGFTLNWGIDTSSPNIEVRYVNTFGRFVNETWSFNALTSALSRQTYVEGGVEAENGNVFLNEYLESINKDYLTVDSGEEIVEKMENKTLEEFATSLNVDLVEPFIVTTKGGDQYIYIIVKYQNTYSVHDVFPISTTIDKVLRLTNPDYELNNLGENPLTLEELNALSGIDNYYSEYDSLESIFEKYNVPTGVDVYIYSTQWNNLPTEAYIVIKINGYYIAWKWIYNGV